MISQEKKKDTFRVISGRDENCSNFEPIKYILVTLRSIMQMMTRLSVREGPEGNIFKISQHISICTSKSYF